MHVKSLQVEQPLEKNWGPGKEEEGPCEKLNVCACKLKSCLTLCHPTDCSPPDSSVLGTLQARTLEWVAMPSSRGSSRPRDGTCVSSISCTGRRALYHWPFRRYGRENGALALTSSRP